MPRRILLADDSITIQKVVELTFSDSDFDVISVGNGDQALRKAREVRPDIALLDVIMPEKNGYEVCQILKQDPDLRRMPVLLLTGTFESFDRERADQVGADGYLTKPFESQMLISKVEELLASAPRQVTPPERAGRMEVVTEGTIMSVETPREPEKPRAAAAPPPPDPPPVEEPPAAPEPAPEAWMEEPEEVSFPGSPASAAPEARAAFQEWAGGMASEPEPPPAVGPAFDEEPGSGPPPARESAEGEPEEAAAPEPPPRPARAPGPPAGFESYEQTFEMQEGTETLPLAAAPPPPAAPEPGTLYTGPEPAEAPAPAAGALTPEAIEQIARRVVQQLSDQVIREVAWEVIPDLAEILIKQRIKDLERGVKPHD